MSTKTTLSHFPKDQLAARPLSPSCCLEKWWHMGQLPWTHQVWRVAGLPHYWSLDGLWVCSGEKRVLEGLMQVMRYASRKGSVPLLP